jgi:N-acetyl-alpha-D-muramate 1-phosphate uridylyltransferase
MGRSELAAVVLAAGSGTRLRPLTHFRPKALCPVGDRPLVDHVLERVRRHTTSVAVNVHHGRAQMLAHLAGRAHLSVEAPEALGTAGAVGQLRGWLDGRGALIVNADAWQRDDLSALVSGWDGERIRLLVVSDPDRGDFGPWRFAGASLLPWRLAARLPAEPAGLYELCWRVPHEAGELDLVRSEAPFFDCGTPADYLAANLEASGGESVVGAGAVVEGELARSVVWPWGRVRAGERLVDAIRVGTSVTVPATPNTGAGGCGRARGTGRWGGAAAR